MSARRLAPLFAVLVACGPDGRGDSATSAWAAAGTTAATAFDSTGDLPTTDPSTGNSGDSALISATHTTAQTSGTAC